MMPPIEPPRKILVRAPNWVGDIMMSLPALGKLRERFPAAEIALLARSGVSELYGLAPGVDRVIEYDWTGQHRGARGRTRLARQLRRERFGLAVLFQNAFDAALMAWLARIPQRVGYGRDARGLLLTHAVRVAPPGEIPPHEAYYYLELLRTWPWLHRWIQICQGNDQYSWRIRETGD